MSAVPKASSAAAETVCESVTADDEKPLGIHCFPSDKLAIVPHLPLAPVGTVVKPAERESGHRPNPIQEGCRNALSRIVSRSLFSVARKKKNGITDKSPFSARPSEPTHLLWIVAGIGFVRMDNRKVEANRAKDEEECGCKVKMCC